MNEFQFLLQLIENQYLLVGKNTNFEDYIILLSKYNLNCVSNLSADNIKSFIEQVEKANFEFSGKERILAFDLNLHQSFISRHSETLNESKLENRAKNEAIFNFVKNAFKLTQEEINELSDYCMVIDNRLKEVFEHAISRKCSIMIDAEQSYIQHYFDFLTAHIFMIYNKEDSIASTTLQCYLKMQMCRIMKWFEYCRENNLKVGIKLVRGAYLNEERKLAEKGNYPSPVCDTIEETHKNYNESLKYVFEDLKDKEKV